jgi:DNA-binding winged helix-turn-helix (wHTH) protein
VATRRRIGRHGHGRAEAEDRARQSPWIVSQQKAVSSCARLLDVLCFGEFELDTAAFRLLRDGRVVNVEPQVLDVITHLAHHRDRVVPKEELLDEIWGDRFVSESALTSRIKSARQALGDDGRTQSMIRTAHGRGYQFVPMVTDSDAGPGGVHDAEPLADDPDQGMEAIDRARGAYAAASWGASRVAYAGIGADSLAADDLERWAEAAWWDSEIVECIAVRQEAFRRYSGDGNDCDAARVAIALADDYLHRGSSTVARTWLERAADLLAANSACREAGQLLRLRSVYQLDLEREPERALSINESLRELAAAMDDPDLIAQSLQDHGRILLALGRVDEGMAIIDRSMLVAATSDTSPSTIGRMYCNMLSACVGLGDFKRAQEWSDEAISWCATQGESPFPGVCQVHRVGLRRRLGVIERALDDLEALASNSQFSNTAGSALLEIGEIHLLRGDPDAAEEALLRAHAYGSDATAGLALVMVDRGRPHDAVELLQEALVAQAKDHLVRSRLLPVLVDAAAMAGDVEVASRAADEFSQIGLGGGDALRGCAERAQGTVLLLTGEDASACDAMRSAVSDLGHAGLSFELATARLGLALALGGSPTASLERDAALAIYRDAGATPSGIARLWLDQTATTHRTP